MIGFLIRGAIEESVIPRCSFISKDMWATAPQGDVVTLVFLMFGDSTFKGTRLKSVWTNIPFWGLIFLGGGKLQVQQSRVSCDLALLWQPGVHLNNNSGGTSRRRSHPI